MGFITLYWITKKVHYSDPVRLRNRINHPKSVSKIQLFSSENCQIESTSHPTNGYFNAWSSVLLVSIREFAKLTRSSTRRKTRAGASAPGSPSWRALQSRGWDGNVNEEQHPSPHQQKTCSCYPVRCENSGLASTAINSERLPAPRSPSGDWSVGVTDPSF